jgi:organic hydroperoxide reductase OsmC/OhrA
MPSRTSLTIRSSSAADEVRDLVREAEERCPVCKAIAGNVQMTVDLEVQSVA